MGTGLPGDNPRCCLHNRNGSKPNPPVLAPAEAPLPAWRMLLGKALQKLAPAQTRAAVPASRRGCGFPEFIQGSQPTPSIQLTQGRQEKFTGGLDKRLKMGSEDGERQESPKHHVRG